MGDVVSMGDRGEAVRQEKIASLRQEIEDIKRKKLDVALVDTKYALGTDGSVHHERGEMEIDDWQREVVIGANIRLREIYHDLRALGFEPNAKS